ncbi:unnamed protein product [Blepharisma stoltei]|uniref:non-specific serine/threonine protein kinase n=1 Tax=Blepharisma stoltei TaxID=1481888 RepID=A0AAU9JY80_9CILI|nr:unnamed protein product [Blepharisma stoltei]
MLSIFSEADSDFDQRRPFWLPYNQVCLPIIHEGYLTEITEIGSKLNYYLLSSTCLLRLSQGSDFIETMAILKWKRVIPFTDNKELLKFGFKIGHSDNYKTFYVDNEEDLNRWIDKLSLVGIMDNIEKDYLIVNEIGRGSFATVFLAIDSTNGKKYAIKCFSKFELCNRKNGIKQLLTEIEIMRRLDHPNIVKLFKIYEDYDSVYLVLEYAEGGDLRKKLSICKRFSEADAIGLIQKLLKVVEYMRSLNIVHRDIKLENIFLVNSDSNNDFKLGDFGLASECENFLEGKCGSLGYVAPEILLGMKYSFNVDVFSVGVVFFSLIAGRIPFLGKTTNEIYNKNLNCNIQFNEKCWISINIQTICMIQNLTTKDPRLRSEAKHALRNQIFHKPQDESNYYSINLSPLSYLLTKTSNECHFVESQADHQFYLNELNIQVLYYSQLPQSTAITNSAIS